MTRAQFRRMITQALTLLFVTVFVLLSMNVITDRRLEAQRQTSLQQTFGDILPAEKYSSISLNSYIAYFPSIQAAFSAYDSGGKLLGYIVEVKNEGKNGEIVAHMSFAPDGKTLISLRVISSTIPEKETNIIQSEDFFNQFSAIKMPVALFADLPDDKTPAKEYKPIAGLKDGTFREQMEKADASGYMDFVEIVVKSGRITQVIWDAVPDGGGKSRAKASVDGEFVLADNRVIWAVQAYAMQNKLIEVQDPARIAIKSDGTTEVVPDVKVSVNAFVILADKCIKDSKNGRVSTSGQTQDGTAAIDETKASSVISPTAAANSLPAASSDATGETSENNSGSEDGVIQNDLGSALTDMIDGLPAAEMKTGIAGMSQAQDSCRTVVSAANQAYIFLMEYLTGGS